MKLLNRTSLYYMIFGIPILVLSGFVCYAIATEEIEESSDALLSDFNTQIKTFIFENDSVSLKVLTKDKEVSITRVKNSEVRRSFFSDTLVQNKQEGEYSENRMLTSFVKKGDKYLKIKIWRSMLESDQLIWGIFSSMITVLISLTLIFVIINLYISKVLWQPFYTVIDNLKGFNPNDRQSPAFKPSNIVEFNELNVSLDEMMKNMIADYGRQKKFTEHASHEIQTPLAVIKSKIDLLIQSENLGQSEARIIMSIDDACSKLIRINRSLLLLTKIENRQFKATDKVSFQKKVLGALSLFDDHIKSSHLDVVKNFEADFSIHANADLCLVLANNLIQNAIRHNIPGGKIIITMTTASLSIANTGLSTALDAATLYSRFNKNADLPDSVGLGLAIAREIAEASHLSLAYSYQEGLHVFSLKPN
ncbi:MAG: hypothetical protein CFE23_12875 [Flavobacterium sp. BFFFF1]|uniref:sensor histidine kinase n=1 Tax=Flavobacterium sp. BFFFF1 TaxID=2015557 RepID=UPI000BD83493|nr:HAMP domain-containing sensor histidine kinase [Flavobacterium sp. BFFFF1]OYU79686.1 MAG: hypothetical protein CFE23_12875 [Flavobacterium sp. BFFFF1]